LVIYPKWYLTSPDDHSKSSSSVAFYKNYLKIDSAGLSKTQWRVFNLPRWAIPKTKFYTPCFADSYTIYSSADVAEFNPYTPNLL